MVLFELSFPGEDQGNITGLYYHATPHDSVRLSEEGLQIQAGVTVCFDAYFNILSHTAYRQHTALQAVDVRLHIKGDFRLRVRFAGSEGAQSEDEILVEETLQCPERQMCTSTFQLLDSMTEGFYYLELVALSDLLLTEGAFCVPEGDWAQESRLAIVICTYCREAYLRRNVERILSYFSLPKRKSFWERIDILVVDNEQTLDPSSFDNSHVTVLPNENTGGSGGFGRGMQEVRKKGSYTHFCLMDDDIVLEPGILLRTLSFLDLCAKDFPELSIGGAMLSLEIPWEQYEMGGRFTGYQCISQKTGLDLRKRESLLANEHPEHPDFNAWWYMCMPCIYLEKYGLPFPFFVKGDDIDYGLRIGSNVLVMNGVGVWHEDFKGKDFGLSEYYIKRNELILCALHCKRPSLLKNYKKLVFAVGKQLLMRRYAVVELLFRAYEDFLNGAEEFLKMDQEQLHRELAAGMPKLIPCQAIMDCPIEENAQLPPANNLNDPPRKRQLLDLLRLYLLPVSEKDKRVRYVEITECTLWDFSDAGTIFQYNRKMQVGLLSEVNRSTFRRVIGRLIKILVSMFRQFGIACLSFQEVNSGTAFNICYNNKTHSTNK